MRSSEHPVTFPGTAGAGIALASQLLDSGELWFNLGGIEILLDPASGTLVQSTKRKVKATKLKAIALSHEHLGHSSDVNVTIVATTEGGFHRRGTLLAPSDARHDDPVVLHYGRRFLERLEVLKEGALRDSQRLHSQSFWCSPSHWILIHLVDELILLAVLPTNSQRQLDKSECQITIE